MDRIIKHIISYPERWREPLVTTARETLIWNRAKLGLQGDDPAFFIIGAQKSGSSSLYKYITQHPQVTPALKKEIHFFDKPFRYERGLPYYLAHFLAAGRSQTGRITGEATPTYLVHPLVPERVKLAFPAVKLIAILRDPIDRAYSHFEHMKRYGHETLSFAEALAREPERLAGQLDALQRDPSFDSHDFWVYSYLTRSRYAAQIERWLACFERPQLHVLASERFFADPQTAVNEIFQFLALEPYDLPPSLLKPHNVGHYEQKIEPSLLAQLRDTLRPDVDRLQVLCEQNFGWVERWG